MDDDHDISAEIVATVAEAVARRTPLRPVGGDTKRSLGRPVEAAPLSLSSHRGVTGYEPTELVITARAGTPLRDIEATLDAAGQMLGSEPPHLGHGATLGGTVACGMSGPRRPWAGALRDFVLGVRIVNGRGEMLTFGGQVIKNVAGYDLSRLMTGAQGTLGVLLEVSLRVLPKPAAERTLGFELAMSQALTTMRGWAAKPWPISAACHDGERLRVRLSGSPSGVAAAAGHLGGETQDDGTTWWRQLRERSLPLFADDREIWRLAVPPASPQPDLDGDWLIDWGGGQRWLASDLPVAEVRAAAIASGGHATLVKSNRDDGEGPFDPLPDNLKAVHLRLKQAFDPDVILNPGRLYRDL